MDLFIDLNKAMNTTKLVKKPVQVKGKMGKTFTRMQWTNPNDDQPVMETHHDFADSHHARIRHMADQDKMELANRFLSNDTERAHKFAQATGMRRNPAHLPPHVVAQHIKDHLDKVPQDHIEPHITSHLPEDGSTHGKLGLAHQDHGLPDHEVEKRSGKVGGLDLSKLTEGPKVQDDDSLWYNDDKEADKKLFTNLFGGTSKSGLESVFSDPNGSFVSELEGIDSYKDGPNTKCEIGLSIRDADGEHIGRLNRAAWRDADGLLNVKNVEFTLHSEHQGKGIADTLYKNSEQYWKHLSGGNPLNIHISANISVGVYAWAKKGFDFADDKELRTAKSEFIEFWKSNGEDPHEVLRNCGVNSIDDLKHSWDFATLDDGNKYDITDLVQPGTENERYKSEIQGTGGVGKAFMLGGKSHWKGIRRLNQGSDHDKVSDHYLKQKAGVESAGGKEA